MAVEIDKESFEVDRLGKMLIRRRYLTDSRSEALTGLPAAVDGLPRVGSRGQVWISSTDGRHVVDAVYEGVTEDPDETFDEYEILTEEREQKIESFEDQASLFNDYGARSNVETGRLEFPPNLPKQPKRLGQPLTLDSYKSAPAETPNPLFGATSYGVPYSMANWRMVRKKVPSSLIKMERTVIDKLPSGFDYNGPKKQWYVRPLQKRKSGNAWSIEWSALEISEFKDISTLMSIQALQSKK
jgi:hypothetical protein